ncbi:actin-like protein ALP3b [Besnoitia besnoiti]|uniref:Actin-like protein ALP3b n=1 Tax=Besnoitia besnoiti TaxID=94643 RepID=A0A2A9MNJ2_BESBE|nr:actin-like protein ALP3b [Besnoitia besnoiti]PFH38121.1 actin-like protein ALP3b [Besnoitia besnoiti]
MFSSAPLPSPPLIFDLGAHTLRAGVSGDALPRWIAPSVVGLPHSDLSSASSSFSFLSGGEDPAFQSLARGKSAPSVLSIAPLNPLEKVDHLNLLPVVSYLPSFLAKGGAGLEESGSAGARESRDDKAKKKRKNEDVKKEDKQAESDASLYGAGWETGPGVYSVNIPGFKRLLETACGRRGLDEGSLEGRAVLLTEPNIMNPYLRDSYAELLFEDLKVSRAFLCKKAALACFGCARTSSIVADIGHSNTSVCAVQEGFVLQKSIQEFSFGGAHCAAFARSVLGVHGVPLTPGFAVTRAPLAKAPEKSPKKDKEERGRRRSAGAGLGERRRSSGEGGGDATPGGRTKPDGEEAKGAPGKAGGADDEKAPPPGFTRFVDEKNREIVQIAPCPHVTSSYKDWGENHVLEVLTQVLGECRGRQAASALVGSVLASPSSPPLRGRSQKPSLRKGKSGASRGSPEASGDSAEGERKREEGEEDSSYVLPDGTTLTVGVADILRSAVPEALFSVPLRLHFFNAYSPAAGAKVGETDGTVEKAARGVCEVGLLDGIKKCIAACAGGGAGARRDVTATIIPTGGGSLYSGFLDRFREEMYALQLDPALSPLLAQCGESGNGLSSPLRVVACPVDAERHFASWIGGSILGCLGSFPQFCVTLEEYEEFGARGAFDRKCP